MHRKWLKIIYAPKEELQLWSRFIKTKLKLFPRTLAVVDLYLPLIAMESPSLEALTALSSMVHALVVSTDAHALSVKITLSPSTAGGFTDNDKVARRHSSNRCVISYSSHRLPEPVVVHKQTRSFLTRGTKASARTGQDTYVVQRRFLHHPPNNLLWRFKYYISILQEEPFRTTSSLWIPFGFLKNISQPYF